MLHFYDNHLFSEHLNFLASYDISYGRLNVLAGYESIPLPSVLDSESRQWNLYCFVIHFIPKYSFQMETCFRPPKCLQIRAENFGHWRKTWEVLKHTVLILWRIHRMLKIVATILRTVLILRKSRLILDAFHARGNKILIVFATLFGEELPSEKRTGQGGEQISAYRPSSSFRSISKVPFLGFGPDSRLFAPVIISHKKWIHSCT